MSFTRNNIIILGESDVGKTSVLRQFIDNNFDPNESTTHGVAFRSVDYNYDGLHLKIAIWDPSSLPQYSTVSRIYYKDVSAALIIYDVTNRLSFERTNYWINTIREHSKIIKHISVVGNKIDLRARHEPKHVTRKEGQELAVRKKVQFFETSAKLGLNITELFSITFEGMIKRYVLTPIQIPVIKYKVIVLGDPDVGKTSLVERLSGNPFSESKSQNIGTHFKISNQEVNRCSISLEFWDTNGQIEENSLMPMYYRSAQAVILVYDIQCQQSFNSLNKYLNILHNYCEDMPFVVLLGNKRDKKSEREVKTIEINQFIDENDVIGMCEEVSAKYDQNFDKLVNRISKNLLNIFVNIPLNRKIKIKNKQRIRKSVIKNWFKCGSKSII